MTGIVAADRGFGIRVSLRPRRLPFDKQPGAAFLPKYPDLVMLLVLSISSVACDKADIASGVLEPAVFLPDDFEFFPGTFLCPLFRCFSVKIFAAFGGLSFFNEIDVSGRVAGIARAHEGLGGWCLGLTGDIGFAAV